MQPASLWRPVNEITDTWNSFPGRDDAHGLSPEERLPQILVGVSKEGGVGQHEPPALQRYRGHRRCMAVPGRAGSCGDGLVVRLGGTSPETCGSIVIKKSGRLRN